MNASTEPTVTELLEKAERQARAEALRRCVEENDDDDGYGDVPAACSECGTSGEYAVEWPCSTVRALGGAS